MYILDSSEKCVTHIDWLCLPQEFLVYPEVSKEELEILTEMVKPIEKFFAQCKCSFTGN